MSTRSVIGYSYGDGFRGRYCHWDGYPTYNGKQIWDIVQRDGIDKAFRILVTDNYQWSSLNTEKIVNDLNLDENPDNVVQGYGTRYTDATEDDWVTYPGDLWCTEWAYILDVRKDMMTIVKILDSSEMPNIQIIDTVYFTQKDEPDWEEIQRIGYVAQNAADAVRA